MRSKKEIPVEAKSYSALFFILSGLLGLVTLWGIWNETITRRPWKQIQENFYQYEYLKTKIELEKAQKELPEMPTPPPVDSKELSRLESAIKNADIKLQEALQERKFLQSESDAVNYNYQSALHDALATSGTAGEKHPSVEKWKKKLDELGNRIEGKLTQNVLAAQMKFSEAHRDLAEFYEKNGHLEDALGEFLLAKKYAPTNPDLTTKVDEIRTQVDGLKANEAKYDAVAKMQEKLHSLGLNRSFLGSLLESPFTRTRTIIQHYLPDVETADRCVTCHFAADKSGYERFAQETFEIEGEGKNKPSYQLMHPVVKVDSAKVSIDGAEAESDSYQLAQNGLITFTDPGLVGEVKISYETGYGPALWTHPHRDVLLAKHPVEKFGCTPCHGGQGQALTAKSAHAVSHEEHWLTPVLGLDEHGGQSTDELRGYMQSNCRRCHTEVMMLDYTSSQTGKDEDYAPTLSKGMALFEDLGCYGCHAVDNYPALAKLDKRGPSLGKVGSKVNGIEWLAGWIKNPPSYLPKTKMPRLFPTEGMTKMVYFKDGTKRPGIVTPTSNGVVLQTDDGTQYPYPESAVDRIVDEAKSIAAFLEQMKDATLDGMSGEFSTSPEAIAAGEFTVKTVGCLACHSVDGLGNDFAPNLDSVGSKVKPNFLRQWLRDPKSYDPKTVMPSLRLTDKEIDNIVAYLMSRKASTPSPAVTVTTYGNFTEEIDPKVGESLIRTYGCFGCHNIPGFENESKVGAELGAFGAKTVEEFVFGDTVDIENSWHGWTIGKLTNPRRYQTRRIISRMPVFSYLDPNVNADAQENARALAVLLKSFQPDSYPLSYIDQPIEKTRWIDDGRRLVRKYNCKGCHEIESAGGKFVDVIAAYKGLDRIEAQRYAPPKLEAEGAKVYPEWLFSFLKHPTSVRYGLQVRMPTFGLPDNDATGIIQYFSALSDAPFPYETFALQPPTPADLKTGKQLFESLECTSCHPKQGEVIPIGSDKTGRPDLSLAQQRLKADWIVEWLKNPQKFQPGTAMPQFWLKIGGTYDSPLPEVAGGDGERQMQLVRDYLLSLGK